MPFSTVSIWHLLWRMIRYAQRLYWTDTFLWLFIAGLPAIPGIIIREFFNTLTEQSASGLSVWVWVVLLLVTGLARVIAIFTGRITKTQHRFIMSALIRRNLLAGLLQRPGAEPLTQGATHQSVSPGAIISYFRDDASQIEDNVVGTNEILGEGVFAIASIVLLFSVNVQVTLLVFLPLAAIAALIQCTTNRIKRYRRASRQATQQVTSSIGEMFTAVQAIKVAGAEQAILENFRQLCDRRRQSMVQDRLFTAILESGFENMVSIGTGLILLVASQSMTTYSSPLTIGDFALFVYYLSFITYFLSFLGGFLALSKQSDVSFERMGALLKPNDLQHNNLQHNNTEAVSLTDSRLALVAPNPLYLHNLLAQKPVLPSVHQHHLHQRDRLHELRACNLTYSYPGTQRGIYNISLTLQRGGLTVITGRVGSGKTTLLRVLLGLLPMSMGEIYWNGQLVQSPGDFFVPPRSAYTPQMPQLFSESLRKNILMGQEICDRDLSQACELAVFEQDLATMPEGLETVIGSKGVRLSGGQIQRTAAVRMFVHQPELLVFDDLSSALDVKTEQTLWLRLFAARNTSHWRPTCLVVSHRLTVLQQADHILALQEGHVIAEGTFEAVKMYLGKHNKE